jgi:ring-1,2-phenylacetyl-CoA epoxidase subunit PaaD|tara:strand:- start:85 stop:531 length:447 start_codon:yes stop_codon:yes gene_type:complete
MVETQNIWKILETIPDPEIPVISVVELGVVRDIEMINKQLTITVTPTYSGCPAIQQMQDDISLKLTENGYEDFKIITKLSPAWTTEWMSDKTKNKLKNYGIAPPEKIIECPQCNSKQIELISNFGSTACKALYKCNDCLEPFDYFKCL